LNLLTRRETLRGAASTALMLSWMRALPAAAQAGDGYPNFPTTPLGRFRTVAALAGADANSIDLVDPASPYDGKAVQITIADAAHGYGPAAAHAPVDVTGKNVRFAMKIGRDTEGLGSGASTIKLRLYSSGAPGAPAAAYHEADLGPQMAQRRVGNRFQFLARHATQFVPVGARADLGKIIYERYVVQRIGGKPVVILVGDIDLVPNPRDKAAVIFGFDDGYAGPYTYAFPILAKRGKGGVLFPGRSAADIGATGKIALAQVKELAAHGWQIACQAYDSERAQHCIDAYRAQLKAARDYDAAHGIDAQDGADGSWFSDVGPGSKNAIAPARELFRTMRAFYSMNDTRGPLVGGGETFPFADRYAIQGINMQGWPGNDARNVTRTENALAQIIAIKGVFMPVWHAGLDKAGTQRDAFDAIVAYVDANPDKVEIHTMRSLLDPYLARYGPMPAGMPG